MFLCFVRVLLAVFEISVPDKLLDCKRPLIQGVYKEFLLKYYATMTFIFKSRKQGDIIGNLGFTKICYAISSSNFTAETYRAIKTVHNKFYIFLTLHLRIILVGDQHDTQFLLKYVYFNPLHVSTNSVLIIRKTIVLIQLLV